jgi:uncharacterized protein (TIGR02145 family)
MKNIIKNSVIIVFYLVLIPIFHSCKKEELPTLSTSSVTNITATTASSGGNITSDGGAQVTARGVCWSLNENPTTSDLKTTDGNGTGSFSSDIKCLSFATTYYVRAYAKNSVGTAYGDQKSITTQGTNPIIFNPNLTYGSVSDIEGNCYKTIQIGSQIWMAENLGTAKYNDGKAIPNVTDHVEWYNTITPAYCWYNNDPINKYLYGALYNWYTVNTGKLCPTGWHVPKITELGILKYYLDSTYVVGDKLKESGTTHWISPNYGTNESGFTALPSGYGYLGGGVESFVGIGHCGYWWTSTGEESRATKLAWVYHLRDDYPIEFAFFESRHPGFSVRCVKD